MAMTREEAYEVLGVTVGADMRQIVERYKSLGKQSHPQHNPNDPNTTKTFSTLSIAYATLTGSKKKAANMSLEQMLRQFQEVIFQRNLDALNGAVASSSDDADDEDLDGDGDEEEEDDDNEGYTEENNRTSEISNHRRSEDASPNITEEEKERKKAEKRRLKKKRQKERKKLEKQSNKSQPQSQTTVRVTSPEIETKRKPEPKISDPSSEEDGELDQEAAFVMEAKKKTAKLQAEAPKKKKEKTFVPPKPVEVDDTEPRVLRSRKLAIRGNEMAQVQQYSAATELFTEAISLDPRDFRFFGNRSFCYDRMQQYEKALKDAEKAIELNSNWAKGYFRQGRALAGLKQFSNAEKSFLQVLELDPECSDAIQELFNVRVHQLMDMGFNKLASENAIRVHDNVQVGLESLLAGEMGELDMEEADGSADEEFQVQYSRHTLQQHQKQQAAADVKMNPTNPEGLTALWVGNILPQVTEKKLLGMFQRYGQVTSVRMLHEKYCAFINFSTPESAGLAMQKLQGVECEGQHLLIKFPDNPITSNGNITLRKPATAAAAASSKQGEVNGVKKRGPVNGDECYFWRTTGCSYGSRCRNKHIPEHKEIDKKNWQKA